MAFERKGLRAPKGSVGKHMLVKMAPELHEAVEDAAGEAGVSASEWIRQTLKARLKRNGVSLANSPDADE